MLYELTKDKFLSDNEYNEIIDTCNRYPSRNSTLIKFALASGARASEILSVTLKDMDSSEKSVYLRTNKKGKDRYIFLSNDLFELVYKLALSNKNNKPFNITYQRLVQIWAKYRVGGKKFHSLRHTAAVRLYKKTKDMKLVQLFLGHRHMSTTAIYTDFQYSVEKMREMLVDE